MIVGAVARFVPLCLFVLALSGAFATATAGASTADNPRATAPRWRLVGVEGAAPSSTILPAEAAEGLRRTVRQEGGERERELPADAQVAAAPIRPDYLLRPSLSGGVPTGYVGGWGDYFVSASAGTRQGGDADASFNLGFSLGDPQRLVGMDVYWGIGSFKNLNANGSVGASLGRILVNQPDLQLSVAGGVIDAYTYGTEPNPQPVNGYGALTAAFPLRQGAGSSRTVQFTLGAGGSSFAAIDTTYELTSTGFYGAAGVELLENLGASVGVSGRSTNVVLSWVPFRTLPIFVNLMAADVFASTPWGTVGVLTMGWGDSLQTGFATR